MRNLQYLLFSLLIVAAISCSNDDEMPSGSNILNYDSDNVTAPTLAAGFYEFAARFTNRELSNQVGKSITDVSFYLYDIPSELTVTFSGDLSASEPAAVLSSERIANLTPNAWNTVKLQTPFAIDGSAIWLGIQVDLPDLMQTVGCDAGPAASNGDWLYSDTPPTWETFRSRTNDSVNWNIRATLSE